MATYHSTFRTLADPTRLAIFEKLDMKPHSVGSIASGLPVSRPATSQHLRILVEAELVQQVRVGKRDHYAINPAGMEALQGFLDKFWKNILLSFKDYAEAK